MASLPAPTPPMGWNSWDCFGTTVTESEVLANAEFMAEHLLPYGWDTIVVDIDWSDPTARSHGYNADAPLAMDGYGRLTPDVGRFPSSSDGWPDGDMLPLGRIGIRAERGEPRQDRLTPDERRTLMTLWTIARSPLMIGGDLPTSDPATIRLFTNADVVEVLRTSSNNRELLREGDLVLWGADGADGVRFAAAFNLSQSETAVTLDVGNLGFPASGGPLTELWSGVEVTARPVAVQSDDARGVAPGSAAVDLTLPAHGCALLRFVPALDESRGHPVGGK